MTAMRWQIQTSHIPKNLDELKEILLANRNISESDDFFSPPDPFTITAEEIGCNKKQLQSALDRFFVALEKKQDIVIFGDYDADGICASAVLWHVLTTLKATVRPFIPQREVHGYGLSIPALEEIITEKKPDLIITVDNGIVAHEAVDFARENNVDIIITDHHQPEEKAKKEHLPKANAVVHTTALCGTTVAWMFAREIIAAHKKTGPAGVQKNAERILKDTLDLCGIATVADQVPLLGYNRGFATAGIAALQKSARPGIRALCAQANIDQAAITSDSIGFGIAPRINAMGRLAHGLDALRLLCTGNFTKATEYAQVLGNKNDQRKDMTAEMFAHAMQQAKLQAEEHVLIVGSAEYHEGIIGLIAGRLSERFSKPAIVVSFGKTVAKASARSVIGVNIVEFIREVQADLLAVGGHPMAAGFGLAMDNFEKVQKKLFELGRETIGSELLTPGLEIDCEIPWQLVTEKLVTLQEAFAPFGSANPRPVFILTCEVQSTKRIGAEGKHLKLFLGESDETGMTNSLEALAWNRGEWAESLEEGQKVRVAVKVELNTWQGRSKVQLVIRDMQNPEEAP